MAQNSRWRWFAAAALAVGLVGCGGEDDGAGKRATSSSGGWPGAGGAFASGGGANASGGVALTGGLTGAGGVTGAGGSPAGGETAAGGSPGGAGAPAAGGAASGGGGAGAGGAGEPSSGCGIEPAEAGEGSLDVGGTTRTFIVDLPPSYDRDVRYPILFGFHGATTSGSTFRGQYYGNLLSVAGDDAIVVHPDALGDPTAWGYSLADNVDVDFFDALLAELESRYCVDTNRVFVTGHSSGGYFSNILGCARGDVVRAIAPVSGGGPYVFGGNSCRGQVAVWLSHGSDDERVLLENGTGSRDFWAEANGCDLATSSPVEPSPCVEYSGCDAGYPVRWCEHSGIGHGWPTYAPAGLWSFFETF